MKKSIEELEKENYSLWRQIGGYKVHNQNYKKTVEQLTANLADLDEENKKLRADCADLKSKYKDAQTKYDKIVALPWYKRVFGF